VCGVNWNCGTGWSIAAGKMTHDGSVGAHTSSQPEPAATAGKTFQVTATISGRTTGGVYVGTAGSAVDLYFSKRSANGTLTERGTQLAGSANIGIKTTDGFDGSVTNISIKEVL